MSYLCSILRVALLISPLNLKTQPVFVEPPHQAFICRNQPSPLPLGFRQLIEYHHQEPVAVHVVYVVP
jgi:hypothetical protein